MFNMYDALVQFGCYQHTVRYEWKGLCMVLQYSLAAINTDVCECVKPPPPPPNINIHCMQKDQRELAQG